MAFVVLTIAAATVAQTIETKLHGPNCSDGWPTKMAFVHMKNAGLSDNDSIDFSKTKTTRLASEKIGKNLWHQVYYVTFKKKSGGTIDAIAVHDASFEECSMSGVEVFVVARHLNPDRR